MYHHKSTINQLKQKQSLLNARTIFLLENSNEYMNRNKVEILSIEIYKLYVGFSMFVKTEEIRSFWLDFRKTLSLTEQNFYFVQLINLSFRGQITDRFGLLRRIYDVLHYCAVFLFKIYRYVSLASRISYRLISTIYDSRTAGYAAVNLTRLSQI